MVINLSRASVSSRTVAPARTNTRSTVSSKVISAPSVKTASWMGTKTYPPSPVKLSGTGGAKISLGGKPTNVLGINYSRPPSNVKSITTTPARTIKSMMPNVVSQLPTQITKTAFLTVNTPLASIKPTFTPDKLKAARPIKSMMPNLSTKPQVITPVRPIKSYSAGSSGSSGSGSGSNDKYYAFVRTPGSTGVTKQTFGTRAAQTSYVNQQTKAGNIIDGAN